MLAEIQESSEKWFISHVQKSDIQILGPAWDQRIRLKDGQERPSGRGTASGTQGWEQPVGCGLEVGSFEEKQMPRQPNDKGGGARQGKGMAGTRE